MLSKNSFKSPWQVSINALLRIFWYRSVSHAAFSCSGWTVRAWKTFAKDVPEGLSEPLPHPKRCAKDITAARQPPAYVCWAQHWKKKWSHFDLESWVTGGTKIRPGVSSNGRIFESFWLKYFPITRNLWSNFSSTSDSTFRSKWLHFFFQ